MVNSIPSNRWTQKLSVIVDLSADFIGFDPGNVQILCSPDNDTLDIAITAYSDGQDFRLCFRTVLNPESSHTHEMATFEFVTCTNSGESRPFASAKSGPDYLINVDNRSDKKRCFGIYFRRHLRHPLEGARRTLRAEAGYSRSDDGKAQSRKVVATCGNQYFDVAPAEETRFTLGLNIGAPEDSSAAKRSMHCCIVSRLTSPLSASNSNTHKADEIVLGIMIKVRNRRSSGCYGAVCGTNGTEMMAIVLLSLSIFAILFQEAQPFITQPSMKAQWKGSDDHDGTTNANSKTSRMSVPPGYKFFRRSGRRIGDAGDTTNQVSSYVPSGMSRAEYVALRKTETEQQQKMNYGAWGPRFKQTDRPDGDWMVMPNLWTLGQIGGNRNRNNQGVVNNGENEGSDPTGLRRIPSLARTYGPALVLGYVLVDCLFTAYALWKFDRLRDLAVLRRAHGPAYAVYHLLRSVLSLATARSTHDRNACNGETGTPRRDLANPGRANPGRQAGTCCVAGPAVERMDGTRQPPVVVVQESVCGDGSIGGNGGIDTVWNCLVPVIGSNRI
eukprot:jgi/Psemu1/15873/gm1.15873_g